MIVTLTCITAAHGWFLDSGATVHVCESGSNFVDYRVINGMQVMANRDRFDVRGVGLVKNSYLTTCASCVLY